jgi:DNA-binding response OmpR family regulator
MLYPLSYEGGNGKVSAPGAGAIPGLLTPGWKAPAVRLPPMSTGEATVLVVDDDPVILKLLEVNFQMEGFAVLTAADGEEGVQVARAEHPDVIVSDIMMPRVNGLELVQQLKADPDTEAIPIILLSAKAQSSDVRQGMEAGADDYVTKPFEPLDLVDRVHRLIGAGA